jgi:hypothetical protein
MVEDRPTGGRLGHGPVYLDGGARLRPFLRHDADRTVDVGSVSVAMRRCW